MKTTTETKKEYRQPQMLAMGDAVQSTLGIIGPKFDWLWSTFG